jgi:S1-C subfamily serine protease
MMPYAKRMLSFDSGGQRDLSIVLLVVAIAAILALVWFILRLSADPNASKGLPEEAMLAGVIMVPPSGPWLGVTLRPPEEFVPLTNKPPDGVVILDVMAGSPADAFGLRSGDMIKRVDNTPVRRPNELTNAISNYRAGDTVRLIVSRKGRDHIARVTLGSLPYGTLAAAVTPAKSAWFGANIQNVDELLAQRLSLPDVRGVIISDVYPNSPAAMVGLQQGDVIRRVGETKIKDMKQLESLIAARLPGDTLDMHVWSRGTLQDISVILASPPPPQSQPVARLPEAEVEIEAAWLGLDIIPMTKTEAKELGLPPNTAAMVVDGVAPGIGVDAGFQPGDAIVAVNGKSTGTIAAFQEATEGAVGAVVDVIRFGRHIYISVPPPDVTKPNGKQNAPVSQIAYVPQ